MAGNTSEGEPGPVGSESQPVASMVDSHREKAHMAAHGELAEVGSKVGAMEGQAGQEAGGSVDGDEHHASRHSSKAVHDSHKPHTAQHLQQEELYTPKAGLNAASGLVRQSSEAQSSPRSDGKTTNSSPSLASHAAHSSPISHTEHVESKENHHAAPQVHLASPGSSSSKIDVRPASSRTSSSRVGSSSLSLPHSKSPGYPVETHLSTASSSTHTASASRSKSTTPPSTVAVTPSTSDHKTTVRRRRRSQQVSAVRKAARGLLETVKCPECDQPLKDPVSLPCGHSACLRCLLSNAGVSQLAQGSNSTASTSSALGPSGDAQAGTATANASNPSSSATTTARSKRLNDPPPLPCASHVPPRFPLSSSTVPCPVQGCPRSAIGRGLGLWAGQTVRYSADLHPAHQASAASGSNAPPPQSSNPGVPPVDGFVIGAPEHSVRLSVIPAQKKEQLGSFYVNVFGEPAEPEYALSSDRASLRMDVTLIKVLNVLRTFAGVGDGKAGSNSSGGSGSRTSSGRDRERAAAIVSGALARRTTGARRKSGTLIRRKNARAAQASMRGMRTGPPEGPHSEAHLESGTQGGISAVWTRDGEAKAQGISMEGAVAETPFHEVVEEMKGEDGSVDDDLTAEDDTEGEEEAPTGEATFFEAMDRSASKPKSLRGSVGHRAIVGRSKRRRSLVPLGDSEGAGARNRSAYSPHPADSSGWESEPLGDAHASKVHNFERVAETINKSEATVERLHAELLDTLECQLCYNLLYKPLTTPCGHTFCRSCFSRSLDHSDKCPLCRTTMPAFGFFQEHPCNHTLVRLLTTEVRIPSDESSPATSPSSPSGTDLSTAFTFKHLYDARRIATEQEEHDSHLSTPVFVCTLAFPGMPTVLHIFEPKYRLMVRRCLESGNPRFGMVLPSRNMNGPVPGVSAYGTMLEIKSVQMLPDGRSMLETVGSFRFRLLEKGSLDGYTVGRIERVDDISPEEETELEAAAMARNAAMSSAPSAQPPDPAQLPPELHGFDHLQSNDEASTDQPDNTAGNTEASTNSSPAPATQQMQESGRGGSGQRELSTAELVQICMSFIHELRSGSAPWLLTRLNSTYGPMPEAHEVERLGYWMALIMPIDEQEKAKLLPIRSPRLRLRLVVHWIEQLRQSWWFSSGCSIA